MEKTEKSKQLTLRLPEETHRALKVRAASEGTSIGAVLETLIHGYLNGNGKKK